MKLMVQETELVHLIVSDVGSKIVKYIYHTQQLYEYSFVWKQVIIHQCFLVVTKLTPEQIANNSIYGLSGYYHLRSVSSIYM
jgi:hypothetical protein